MRTASGLYMGLTAPGGLTTYYDPLTGLGFSRRQEAVLNTYAQNINPFAGWTFGAYAQTAQEFGVGEIKGFGNYAAGFATLGFVSNPIAAYGQNEQAGAETLPVIADTVQYVDGIGELAASADLLRGGAAKIVAGAKSLLARKGGGCFVAGTLVQMADGTTKPIEQIKAGDFVKSRNPQTGVTEAKRVLQTTVRQTDQVLTLALTDPKTGRQEQITTTGEHPFFVDGKGFVKAGDLGIGTSIVTRAGPALTLNHLTWQNDTPSNSLVLDGQAHRDGYIVYNLIVEGDHTYFVGTVGGGAWVHNVDCYPAYFEMQLDLADWGTTGRTHFKKANEALLAAFNKSSTLRSRLATMTGKTEDEVRAAIQSAGNNSPVVIGDQQVGFTWHHALSSQAGGKKGVMQLVGYKHHADPLNWGTYHPGNRGGFAEWAKPLGARR